MIRIYIKNIWFTALFAILIPSALSCIYPVYNGDTDIEEQHSVWQYLSVYSIYQDRLPDECGDYTPNQLFDIIDDNLNGARYTGYRRIHKTGAGASAEIPEAAVSDGNIMIEITDATAYISISGFWQDALEHFQAWRPRLAQFQNIVIDLRDNGGGYLYVTDSIVGEFLPTGTGYIVTDHRVYDDKNLIGRTVEGDTSKNRKTNPRLADKKISVLVNGGSASASEILASALKDGANAHLLGVEKTYGKGIGQVIIPRTGRDSLSITFMQIRGVSERTGAYHREGIEPDTIPEYLRLEARDSCYLSELNLIDQSLYCAVKLMEPSAPSENILKAARELRNSSPMTKERAAKPVGVYVVTEPDPLR